MSAVTSERVLRVDLTGSKLGPAWRGSEQYGDWPADWSDDRLRQECADHFAIPVEQVTVIPANAEVCPGCEWHILADGCRGDSDACVRP
jgi:hypothetical protein